MQEQAIRGLAMMRGIANVEMFIDKGVSGGIPLSSRPAVAKLLATLAPRTLVVAESLTAYSALHPTHW
jgi:hypothetical protein